MKSILSALFMLLPGTLLAIPNSILGPVAAANSPFNGRDLTADLIDDALRAGKAELPGTWQEEFSSLYAGQLGAVRSALAGMPEMDRPRETKVGHTRTLRTVTEDFTKGGLTFRLLASEQRLVRLTIGRDGELPDSWLDPEIAATAYLTFVFRP